MANRYFIQNSALQTTAAPVKQTTLAVVHTLMKIKLGAGIEACIRAWGISFDGQAAATPGQVELFECTESVTTVMTTAYVNADIQPWDPNAPANASNFPVDVTSTSTSGFSTAAITEGTCANIRNFDGIQLAPTDKYANWFPLGQEPILKAGNFTKIRVTFGTAVNAYCWILLEI